MSAEAVGTAAVKFMTPSISLVCTVFGRRPEEHAAMCHMLRPDGPLMAPVYAPGGHDRPRQLVWFWRSVELRQGGYGGACWGMGLQMGRSRRRGREGRRESRTGWTVRRITEHKRHVSKTE